MIKRIDLTTGTTADWADQMNDGLLEILGIDEDTYSGNEAGYMKLLEASEFIITSQSPGYPVEFGIGNYDMPKTTTFGTFRSWCNVVINSPEHFAIRCNGIFLVTTFDESSSSKFNVLSSYSAMARGRMTFTIAGADRNNCGYSQVANRGSGILSAYFALGGSATNDDTTEDNKQWILDGNWECDNIYNEAFCTEVLEFDDIDVPFRRRNILSQINKKRKNLGQTQAAIKFWNGQQVILRNDHVGKQVHGLDSNIQDFRQLPGSAASGNTLANAALDNPTMDILVHSQDNPIDGTATKVTNVKSKGGKGIGTMGDDGATSNETNDIGFNRVHDNQHNTGLIEASYDINANKGC